jgi:hypothetical protein
MWEFDLNMSKSVSDFRNLGCNCLGIRRWSEVGWSSNRGFKGNDHMVWMVRTLRRRGMYSAFD